MTFQKALEAYIAATNTHDFNEVEKLLHPQAVYWFTDKSCTTAEQIRTYFENAWDLIREEVYSVRDVQWIAEGPRSAACIYTYVWEGYHKGEFVSGSGRGTNVFVKDAAGEWKLVHEHLSGAV
ncbi:nuclear transport factor 2 family protein [Paenibacillus chitinolyticus]|uniref:YybH family protein n=1 Tax=Paenibacillus chitinolyticus TaxID=79263 RepID=UPI002DBCDBD4|nr:nuclear transport factor 2 family protein [Paenibacillus chitinolyticus]MEC0248091.1 nuclear transport factor 2 family protein [Paenibacillus chitinolyticus]